MAQKIIMVVDDDPVVTTYLEAALRRGGYVVLKADSAMRALDLLAQIIPHLFIVDVMMPGVDGIELCRQIRAQEMTASTPIVILSADTNEQNKRNSFAAGANDFLTKPLRPADLLERLKTHLTPDTANGASKAR